MQYITANACLNNWYKGNCRLWLPVSALPAHTAGHVACLIHMLSGSRCCALSSNAYLKSAIGAKSAGASPPVRFLASLTVKGYCKGIREQQHGSQHTDNVLTATSSSCGGWLLLDQALRCAGNLLILLTGPHFHQTIDRRAVWDPACEASCATYSSNLGTRTPSQYQIPRDRACTQQSQSDRLANTSQVGMAHTV